MTDSSNSCKREPTIKGRPPRFLSSVVPFPVSETEKHKSACVKVTNDGVIPTRFTVTSTTSTSPSTVTPELEHSRIGHAVATNETCTSGSENLNRVDEGEGLEQQRRAGTDSWFAGSSRETELLDKAATVGDAGLKYPEGRGAIEVFDGGGELTGYGSAEIVVVFAPFTVGDFRTVKVRYIMIGSELSHAS